MSDFGNGIWVNGRKIHYCGACGARIPKGEEHYSYRGMYGGDWQNWRMHRECEESFSRDGSGEFMEGDTPVPERILAMFKGMVPE